MSVDHWKVSCVSCLMTGRFDCRSRWIWPAGFSCSSLSAATCWRLFQRHVSLHRRNHLMITSAFRVTAVNQSADLLSGKTRCGSVNVISNVSSWWLKLKICLRENLLLHQNRGQKAGWCSTQTHVLQKRVLSGTLVVSGWNHWNIRRFHMFVRE